MSTRGDDLTALIDCRELWFEQDVTLFTNTEIAFFGAVRAEVPNLQPFLAFHALHESLVEFSLQ